MDYRLAKLVQFIRHKYSSDTNPFAEHLDILQAHLEDLWGYFKDHAEPNFAGDFTNGSEASLCQRYWEMYLTAKYLKLGFKIKKYPDGGPDIGLETNQGMIWIEAVTPDLGEDKDLRDFYKIRSEPVAYTVPHEKLTLRVTNAVTNKIKQRNNFIKNRPETASDSYIIAINTILLGHYGQLADVSLFDKDELRPISGFITSDAHLLHSANSEYFPSFSNGEVFIPNPNAYCPISEPALLADQILVV